MSKIRFIYSLSDKDSLTFALAFEPSATMGEILEKISERRMKTYTTIFLHDKKLDAETELQDVWSENAHFVLSTESTPPSQHNYLFTSTIKIQGLLEPTTKSFDFFFTGGTKDNLLNGIRVELDNTMDPNSCREKLQSYLQDKIDLTGKQLLVYLPGGVPFISSTLDTVYSNEDLKPNRFIYGVITRSISDSVLNENYPEICNVSDQDHRLLISPLVNSTDRGLSDMACLLGILNHGCFNGDRFLRICASVVRFPPLITSMNRIIDRNQVTGRDVVVVCSTLYTYFRASLPPTCPDEQVLEYCLRICNLFLQVKNPPEKMPIIKIKVKPGNESTKFLFDLKLGNFVYFWGGDNGYNFDRNDLELKGIESIDNAYKLSSPFTPIAPLSMRSFSDCAIVKGKTHEYLYLMQSPSKNYESQNMVQIIDPMTGMTESIDVEEFAKEQNDTANLVDPDIVKQIIMVNFDESKSMIGDLAGSTIPPNSDKVNRVTIAYQYLANFVNLLYGYRIPCIQGLVSFNNNVEVRCPLSPIVSDFEDNRKINQYRSMLISLPKT